MKSARSASSAFGIVAGAAIVTSSIGLLGSTAAEASTANATDVSAVGASAPACAASPRRRPPRPRRAVRPVGDRPRRGLGFVVQDPEVQARRHREGPDQQRRTPRGPPQPPAVPRPAPKATSSATARPAAAPVQPQQQRHGQPEQQLLQQPQHQPSSSPFRLRLPSPSPTGTGSPSPSPTGSSPSVQLCLEVQPITTKAGVHPGSTASYAIWVWPAGGAASSVSVTISSKAASKNVTPKFTVCPTASGADVQGGRDRQRHLGRVAGDRRGAQQHCRRQGHHPHRHGQVQRRHRPARRECRDQDHCEAVVKALAVTVTTPTPASSSPLTGSGIGATLPPGILPTVPLTTTQGATLGELPGPTTSAGSPGGLFPTVSPQPSASPSPYSAVLPNARNVRVTDAAATFPFSTRLIGGELVGLAVLAAALAIAIVRFSLRRPRPQHGKDAAS